MRPMIRHTSFHTINLTAALFTLAILAFAVFLQIHKGLSPCPLCIIERGIFIILAVLFIIGSIFFFKRKGQMIFHGIALIFTVLGVLLASRHIYIQHVAIHGIASCGPNFQILVKQFPFSQIVRLILLGTGECTVIGSRFIGLSLSEWSLICFCVLLITALSNAYASSKKSMIS